MVSLLLVLVVLERYGSATLAGATTFLLLAPGLLISPIAGALLDRHGRVRLIVLDYVVAAASLVALATLSALDSLPVPLLLAIVTASSLTFPLSTTGQRTLFPLLVPRRLWERANAIDSNGYVVASIFGPALAGALIGALHGEGALLITAAIYGLAAVVTVGVRDPETDVKPGESLLRDAWDGLVYVVRHATLRGLALSTTTSNVAYGIFFITVPVIVLQQLNESTTFVGQLFALMGVTGFFSVLLFGRMRSAGREPYMLVGSTVVQLVALLLMLARPEPLALALAMAISGIAVGPFDIALFTLRQRSTDPAWLGRAFAVSMALNFAGFPVGSALGGALSASSTSLALGVAFVVSVIAIGITLRFLPRE